MFGCATAPFVYTASMTFDASGANASALHSFVIVLSITAIVQGGDVPVCRWDSRCCRSRWSTTPPMSGLVERPTLQSTSWSITTLK